MRSAWYEMIMSMIWEKNTAGEICQGPNDSFQVRGTRRPELKSHVVTGMLPVREVLSEGRRSDFARSMPFLGRDEYRQMPTLLGAVHGPIKQGSQDSHPSFTKRPFSAKTSSTERGI